MNKYNHVTYRLWIASLKSIKKEGDLYSINSKPVVLIMIQGIIINYRKTDSNIQIILDDGTGVIRCTFYFQDYDPIDLKSGSLIRVCGKLTSYLQELQLKLTQPPLKIENFDEEYDWASSVHKLWTQVYSSTPVVEQGKELVVKAEVKKLNIYDLAAAIRESKKSEIYFNDFEGLCENYDEIFEELVHDGFLIPDDDLGIKQAKFSVSCLVYLPKEVVTALFLECADTISFVELMEFNNRRFAQFPELVSKAVSELMEQNFLYEVSDGVYSRILY